MRQSIYKPFLIFSSIILVITLLLFYSSPIEKINWGNWNCYSYENFIPFILLSFIILGIFVYNWEKNNSKREKEDAIKLVKVEQEAKDFREFSRILELQNSQLINELSLFRKLYKTKEVAEEKLNEIFLEIKDKIKLSQIYELPELAINLIEKIINIKDKFGVKLIARVEGNLTALKRLDQDDLKQTINFMLSPICENYKNIDVLDWKDISLFIKEHEDKVTFKVAYDYINSPISTEMIEWNIKKMLHKYGCDVSAINEKEDDTLVLMITVDIPKQEKFRKII